MKKTLSELRDLLGITQAPVSHTEKILSAVGGFLAIFLIAIVSEQFMTLPASIGIVASMGASAVLLFAAPHGPLSQPWPLIGGHLVSAAVGVSCALWIQDPILAASSAVGLAIAAMYYLKCIHPPGGATALTAVIGGESVHQLGYQFLLTPVLLDLTIILSVAWLFNYLFYWRRYPAYLQQHQKLVPTQSPEYDPISHHDFLEALKQIDSFVDINEYDLKRIFELANIHASQTHLSQQEIHLGGVYSNGEIGKDWSMRQIVDESPHHEPNQDYVIFKQIAGQASKRTDCVTRAEFARWAKYEMVEDAGRWHRKEA